MKPQVALGTMASRVGQPPNHLAASEPYPDPAPQEQIVKHLGCRPQNSSGFSAHTDTHVDLAIADPPDLVRLAIPICATPKTAPAAGHNGSLGSRAPDHSIGLLFLSTIHIQIHTHLKWRGYG
jgi:hypothetical protein